jgi:hypothetical protein
MGALGRVAAPLQGATRAHPRPEQEFVALFAYDDPSGGPSRLSVSVPQRARCCAASFGG